MVLALQVAPTRAAGDLLDEPLEVTSDDCAPRLPVAELATHRDAMVDAEAIAALRQSRYCPSDALAGFAAVELAGLGRGPDLSRSVASWVLERLAYEPGLSGPLDTAVDALLDGAATSPT